MSGWSRVCRCLFITLLASHLALGSSASAAPSTDQNGGTWDDDFRDSAGIDAARSSGWLLDAVARQVTLASGASAATLMTVPVRPASTDRWGSIYLRYAVSDASELRVAFLDEADNERLAPIIPTPSDVAGWDGRVDLADLDPAIVAAGRVKILLTKAGTVSPTLRDLRVTWRPRAVLRTTLRAAVTACAGATLKADVPISVSSVNALGIIAWVTVTDGIVPTDFGQTRSLSGSASFTATPLTLDGVTIPARSFYRRVGDRRAGESFKEEFTLSLPTGALDGTRWDLSAGAAATNANPVVTAAQPLRVAGSAPALSIDRSVAGPLAIGGQLYADPGTSITYTVTVRNAGGTCVASAHRVVVWDDLTRFDLPAGSMIVGPPSAVTGNGEVLTAAKTFYPAGDASFAPIAVPARSLVWDLGTLAPGAAARVFQYTVTLAAAPPLSATPPRTQVATTTTLRSAYAPNGLLQPAAGNTVQVGVPYEPVATFALGERIRGSAALSPSDDDQSQVSVGYDEPFDHLLGATNTGASTLTDVLMVYTLPAGARFVSAYLPPAVAGSIRYSTTTADVDADGNLGAAFVASADPSAVRYVAFRVPRLGTPFTPTADLPSSVVAEVRVVTLAATGLCPDTMIEALAAFDSYGVLTPTGPRGDRLTSRQRERTRVLPLLPSLVTSAASVSPNPRVGSGDLHFTIDVANRFPGGAATDFARDVVATLRLPTASLNGVARPLDFVAVTTDGTIDYSGLPNTLRVTWPSIAPATVKPIRLTLRVPRGIVDGATVSLAATLVAQDDLCGETRVNLVASTQLKAGPYLSVAHAVDLTKAGQGGRLVYRLDWVNSGDGVSRDTWVVTRIPDGVTLDVILAPTQGESVWVASTGPASVRADFPWSDESIRASFTRVLAGPDGRIHPPSGTRWVAVDVDDERLSPAVLPTLTSPPRHLDYEVLIAADAPSGTLLAAESAIFSKELGLAVSNQVQTLVSPDPSLVVTRACPDVAAVGETVTLTTTYANDSSNPDDDVVLEELLPPEATLVQVITSPLWLGAGTNPVQIETTADYTRVRWLAGQQLGRALGTNESLTLTVQVRIEGIESGRYLGFSGRGTATNAALPTGIALDSGCAVLVQNPDLFARIAASELAPVAGEELTLAFFVSNAGARAADDVRLGLTLPAGLTLVPNSARVLTPGFAFSGTTPRAAADPVLVDGSLVWSATTGNALIAPPGPAGQLPGDSGDVQIAIKVRVAANVPPETQLTACARAAMPAGGLGEDPILPNEGCVTLRTPLPDPWVEKTGPATGRPGERYSYTLSYGNHSRQAAFGVVFFDRLWDDPTPAPDGTPDVRLLGVAGKNGEEIFFSDAPLGETPPAFDTSAPNPPGWTRDLASLGGRAAWIAVRVATLPGLAAGRDLTVDLELRHPITDIPPQAGTVLTSCVDLTLGTRDDNSNDNSACLSIATPGLDLAVAVTCSPAGGYPGLRPGDVSAFEVVVTNQGSEPVYGVRLRGLPSPLTTARYDALFAELLDAGGQPATPLDPSGQPLRALIPWTPVGVGNEILLGDATPSARTYYRKVGLAPGQHVVLRWQGPVADSAASQSEIRHEATVATDYRNDWVPGDPEEELVLNNRAACVTTVYRPDPIVVKLATDITGGAGPIGLGERIDYTLRFDNLGRAAADGVVLEDLLPDGLAFVTGSLADAPDGVAVEYQDRAGDWDYTPVGVTGQPDPEVAGLRLRWTTPMQAPLGGTFRQDSAIDFARGRFDATTVAGDSVVASGAPAAYRSPTIPSEGRAVARRIARGREARSTQARPDLNAVPSVAIAIAAPWSPAPLWRSRHGICLSR